MPQPAFIHQRAQLVHADCLDWLRTQPDESIHAVVTDPPYGLVEYTETEQHKLRAGTGGVWRQPPTLDGVRRAPLPRFTTLTENDLTRLDGFFTDWARTLLPVLTPGAHVLVATNPLLSHRISVALDTAGLERRGELVRLVQTMRGGDRPKGAHREFANVTVMPRSQWEPWLLFRKPLPPRMTVAECLRIHRTGGLRRLNDDQPFGDVIRSHPTPKREKALADHPSLKPQAFLRAVVRAMLPFGEGVVLDPFAGSGSTLAAANALGYASIGVERDSEFVNLSRAAIPALGDLVLTPRI